MILKASLIVFSVSLVGNFLGYIFHLITGRFLSPDQYSLLESFIALDYFLAVLIATFSFSIINQINSSKPSQLPQLIPTLEKLSLKITVIFWLIFLLLFPPIKHLLHLTNPFIFLIFSLKILFSFFPTLYLSILRAKLKFLNFSLIGLISSFVKIIITTVFLFLGWQVFGAIAGMTITGLVTAFTSCFFTKKILKLKKSSLQKSLPKSFWRFSLLALITQLSLTSLYSSDILLTRYYLPSFSAGIYSAASVMGKIIFFVSAIILTVSFPIFNQQKQSLIKLKSSFLQAFSLITIVSLTGLLVYQFFPDLITQLLYRSAYSPAAVFLPQFALFMAIFALFNLIIQFLLATHQKIAGIIAFSTALLQIFLIILHHSSLTLIIRNSIISTSLGLLFSLWFAIKTIHVKKA